MSDHAWTQEHVAAYVVGGLTADETERLDGHVRGCPDCAAAVDAARRLDRDMTALFADVRPAAGLEDRAVQSARTVRRRSLSLADRLPRWAVAAMILLALGTFGAMIGALVSDGRLPLPGDSSTARILVVRKSTVGEPVAEPASGKASSPPPATAVDDSKSLGTHLPFVLARPTNSAGDMTVHGGIGGGIQGGIGGIGGIQGGIGGVNHTGILGGDLNGTVVNGGTANHYGYHAVPGTSVTPNVTGGTFVPDNRNTTIAGNAQTRIDGPNIVGGTLPRGFGQNPIPQFSGYFTPPTNILNVTSNPGASVRSFLPEEGRPAAAPEPKQPEAAQDPKDRTAPKPAAAPPADDAAPTSGRVILRSGEMEFEVNSFGVAEAHVIRLVSGLKGAFVATVNSEKLANGKVRGSVTVRTPPEHLDRLVLDLRQELAKAGELKGMKVTSQDVTKQYTDLESRLRAARAMEQRLLQMIKDGKGEIKQLLEAEKELGVWRTRIEEVEGELRYYANLAALATLTVSLTEKEIRTAAEVSERERVQAGVETEDVDAAYRQTLAAVAEAKGRVAKSELKQLAAGQYNASLQFEVPPDAAGPMRDRLRQLGRVARLEIDRVQHAAGGSTPADVKVKRGDTLFLVQLYNLANIAPRETTTLQVAVPDVRAAFQALRDAAAKAKARVRTAQLNEQDAQNVTAQLDVELARADEGAIRTTLDSTGEAVSRQVTRAPESDEFTDSKVLYRVTLLAATRLSPRETTTMTVEVADVDQAAAVFAAQVAEANGRQVNAQSSRERSGKVTARLTYEVPLAAAGLVDRLKAAGTVRSHQSARDPQAPAGRFATARFDVTLVSGEHIVAEDEGLWPPIRRGLTYSATVLLTSVTWVVFGLCVVLPWGVVGYAGYRLVRRLGRPARPAAASVPTQG